MTRDDRWQATKAVACLVLFVVMVGGYLIWGRDDYPDAPTQQVNCDYNPTACEPRERNWP